MHFSPPKPGASQPQHGGLCGPGTREATLPSPLFSGEGGCLCFWLRKKSNSRICRTAPIRMHTAFALEPRGKLLVAPGKFRAVCASSLTGPWDLGLLYKQEPGPCGCGGGSCLGSRMEAVRWDQRSSKNRVSLPMGSPCGGTTWTSPSSYRPDTALPTAPGQW